MNLENKENLDQSLARLKAYWQQEVIDRPVLWITAPSGEKKREIPAPATPKERWTNPDYVFDCLRERIKATYYAGDAIPTYEPKLGPSVVNGWFGAEIIYSDETSWVHPHVPDVEKLGELRIDRSSEAWTLYMRLLKRSLADGQGRWVTAYPDLHTGADALAAARGPEQLVFDMMDSPEAVQRGVRRMTEVWKEAVDAVSELVLPAGQGTTNWMSGWSDRRFVVVGQNDFTCMVSPDMFTDFFLADNNECCRHVEHTIYHLDGPGALPHLDAILGIRELNAVQWVPGAGAKPMSEWLDVLQKIQAAGKSLHIGCKAEEIPTLLAGLKPEGLLINAWARSRKEADEIVRAAARR